MSLLAFASGTHEVVGPFDSPAKNTFQAKSSGWDPFHTPETSEMHWKEPSPSRSVGFGGSGRLLNGGRCFPGRQP